MNFIVKHVFFTHMIACILRTWSFRNLLRALLNKTATVPCLNTIALDHILLGLSAPVISVRPYLCHDKLKLPHSIEKSGYPDQYFRIRQE